MNGLPHCGGALGLGLATNEDSYLLVTQFEGSSNHLLVSDGIEYNHALDSGVHPWGLRLRGEAGPLMLYRHASDYRREETYLETGLVPAVWWMPFHGTHSAHRFILATEVRGAGLASWP